MLIILLIKCSLCCSLDAYIWFCFTFFCLFSKFFKLPFSPAFSIHMSHFMNFKFYIIQCFFYRNSLLPLTPEEVTAMSNDLNTVNSLLRSVEHIDRKVLFRSVEHIDRKVWADFAVHDWWRFCIALYVT